MPAWQNVLLAVVAVLFAGLLVWKYRPIRSRVEVLPVGDDVRRAREKVRAAASGRGRAEALMLAGELAARDPSHVTAAVGYYLRAMRADPAWCGPILGIRHLL